MTADTLEALKSTAIVLLIGLAFGLAVIGATMTGDN